MKSKSQGDFIPDETYNLKEAEKRLNVLYKRTNRSEASDDEIKDLEKAISLRGVQEEVMVSAIILHLNIQLKRFLELKKEIQMKILGYTQ